MSILLTVLLIQGTLSLPVYPDLAQESSSAKSVSLKDFQCTGPLLARPEDLSLRRDSRHLRQVLLLRLRLPLPHHPGLDPTVCLHLLEPSENGHLGHVFLWLTSLQYHLSQQCQGHSPHQTLLHSLRQPALPRPVLSTRHQDICALEHLGVRPVHLHHP